MLQKGDVYIADGFGKVADGTLIGDNLGNSIFAKTGTGVVFDAGARDLDGLKKIEGFNACVRGWDPSFLKNVILSSINRPIRIGPTTVLPGDVILARREGVIVIPPHLAEEVVVTAEIVALKDEFGHLRLKAGSLHARPDRRPLDRTHQGRLLQVAGVTPGQAADPGRADREASLMRRIEATRPARYSPARIARMRRPTIASSPGSIIQTPMPSSRTRAGGDLDAGRALAELLDHAPRRRRRASGSPSVIRRCGTALAISGTWTSVLDVGEFLEGLGDPAAARLPFLPDRGVVLLQVGLEGHQHADDLFLVDLVGPAEGVAVGAVVEPGRLDQVLAAQQQARRLRPAQALAAGEADQVEPHLGVSPEVLDRRDVRGRVDQRRDVVLLGDLDEFLVVDLPLGVGEVEEEHHRGPSLIAFSSSSRVSTSIIFTPALRMAWS